MKFRILKLRGKYYIQRKTLTGWNELGRYTCGGSMFEAAEFDTEEEAIKGIEGTIKKLRKEKEKAVIVKEIEALI